MRVTLAVRQAAVVASTEAVIRTSAGLGGICLLAKGGWSTAPRTVMSLAADEREIMQVKKLSANAIMPVRGSDHAAGFDLASAYDETVPAGRQALIKTDLSIAIPPNTYARIAPRSGLAVKKMIDVGAGVVDYDYRGPVGVVLFNHGTEDFKVNKGDRVAQLILERISMAELQEVTELSETTRGTGGFGSTGVAREAMSDMTSVPNGYKKLKTSKPGTYYGPAYVTYLLALVKLVASTLDIEPTSVTLLPLRTKAVEGSRLVGDSLEGVLGNYSSTKNIKELEMDVRVILEKYCSR